jgi:hypothetical protein
VGIAERGKEPIRRFAVPGNADLRRAVTKRDSQGKKEGTAELTSAKGNGDACLLGVNSSLALFRAFDDRIMGDRIMEKRGVFLWLQKWVPARVQNAIWNSRIHEEILKYDVRININ